MIVCFMKKMLETHISFKYLDGEQKIEIENCTSFATHVKVSAL